MIIEGGSSLPPPPLLVSILLRCRHITSMFFCETGGELVNIFLLNCGSLRGDIVVGDYHCILTFFIYASRQAS